jgi:hypothetical protein
MKTEVQPEAVMIFPRAVAIAVSELKKRLQHGYEQTYPDLGEIIRIVLDEEEANAWKLSSFPQLLLPDLVEAHIATLGLKPADTGQYDIFAAPMDAQHAVAVIC